MMSIESLLGMVNVAAAAVTFYLCMVAVHGMNRHTRSALRIAVAMIAAGAFAIVLPPTGAALHYMVYVFGFGVHRAPAWHLAASPVETFYTIGMATFLFACRRACWNCYAEKPSCEYEVKLQQTIR